MSIDWRVFALGSAFFAALTAIFGKVGVSDINSDLATFYRTIVILAISALLVSARHEWQAPEHFVLQRHDFFDSVGHCDRPLLDLLFSRAAAGPRLAGGPHR